MKKSIWAKIIVSLLALVMILSMLPLASFAAEPMVLESHNLPIFKKGDKADGESDVVGDFTIIWSAKSKTDSSAKEWSDGYKPTTTGLVDDEGNPVATRINFGGKTQSKKGVLMNAIEFTVTEASTVKIWWVQGGEDGEPRQMAIYNDAAVKEENIVAQTNDASKKNKEVLSTLEVDAAGTYYLGCPTGSNYIFKVEVAPKAAKEEPSNLPPITEPVADTAYKFGVIQLNAGKTLYLTGEMDRDKYLKTTTDKAAAKDMYIESAQGGVKIYFLEGTTKNYIEMYPDGSNGYLRYSENGTVFTYDNELSCWAADLDGTPYYMGAYNTFETLSASKLSFITTENKGKTQFPAGFFAKDSVEEEVEKPEIKLPPVKEPAADTAYLFGVHQNKTEKTLYVNGQVKDDRFLVTTENEAEAKALYVEAAEGGMKLYYLEGTTKNYIEMYLNDADKVCLRYSANGTVFAFNAELDAWTAELAEEAYYIGTYNEFDTLSASKLSFISAGNKGITQFPAGFFTKATTEDGGNGGEDTGNQGGNTGDTGNQGGNTGDTGNQGGNTGDTGNQGGNTGDTGNQGGNTGDTGNQGGNGSADENTGNAGTGDNTMIFVFMGLVSLVAMAAVVLLNKKHI